MRDAAPEISLISFELSMLPQLVGVIVQPETLLRLPLIDAENLFR